MQNHFNHSSSAARRKVDLSQPPRAFEEFNKVSGIAGRYIYPDNISVNQFEQQLRNDHLDLWDYYKCVNHVLVLAKPFPTQKFNEIRRLKDELIELNPILSTIPCDEHSPREVFDIVFGAASSINEEDIAFFMEHRKENLPGQHSAMRDQSYSMLFNSINSHPCTKVKIAWVPCKKTLLNISQQMQHRQSKLRP
jgi:hypothetical protein